MTDNLCQLETVLKRELELRSAVKAMEELRRGDPNAELLWGVIRATRAGDGEGFAIALLQILRDFDRQESPGSIVERTEYVASVAAIVDRFLPTDFEPPFARATAEAAHG